MKHTYFIKALCINILCIACARIGSPTGGEQDKTPPKVLRTTPANGSLHFTGNHIRIYFDEYVTLKDIRKQLIISPPMEIFPNITPTGNASKYIDIKILDTLKPNTTYTFNFGKSIQDNNEGNPLNFYTYTFSTGGYIDSLSLKGHIVDAENPKADNYVNVMLYEVGEKFSDSVVYKKPPMYVSNTLDSLTSFKLTHLKAGKYLLVAMKDKDNNYLFDPKTDKIGFHQEFITLPTTDSSFVLSLFKEKLPMKVSRPFLSAEKRISIGYQGEKDSIKVQPLDPLPADFKWTITKEPKKDTLWLWYHPDIKDSLRLQVKGTGKTDIFTVKYRKMKGEKLAISSEHKSLSPTEEQITFLSNIPLVAFNPKVLQIRDKDSTLVDYKVDFTPNSEKVSLTFPVKEGEKYHLTALSAFEDFYHQKSDTLKESFSAKRAEDFASLKVSFKDSLSLPFIIELTDKDGKNVLYSQYIEKSSPTYHFPYLKAGNYLLRIVEDKNHNKKWDTGNFLQRKQPEIIRYFAKEIELRANWEVEQDISFAKQAEEKPKQPKEKSVKE